MRLHAELAERSWNDFAAEVLRVVAGKHVQEHLARKDVHAHRGDEGLVVGVARKGGAGGNAPADLFEPVARRFFLEGDDLPAAVESKQSHGRGIVDRDRLRSDRDIRASFDVRVDHVAVVHPVKMIPGEDQIVVRLVPHEVPRRLPDGVGGPLKPVRVIRRLLGRENFDEPGAEQIHPVRLRDVPVE